MATPFSRLLPFRHPALAPGLALGLALAWAPAQAAPSAAEPSARVMSAGANSDTLDYGWRDVYPVAIRELERNDWTIQRSDTTARRLVTRWKPLKHVLVRVFLGGVMARCVVDLAPLADGRTVLTIQGGLASDQDIAGSAGYTAALGVYRGAAQRWLVRVGDALDEQARHGLVARVEPVTVARPGVGGAGGSVGGGADMTATRGAAGHESN